MIGRAAAHLVVETSRKCGDDLTREDVMRQAANFHNYRIPMLVPGPLTNTRSTDYEPMQSVHFARFEGDHFVPFGELLSFQKGR
jgi:branched-chain amino acid transport system substrate-binding protein